MPVIVLNIVLEHFHSILNVFVFFPWFRHPVMFLYSHAVEFCQVLINSLLPAS